METYRFGSRHQFAPVSDYGPSCGAGVSWRRSAAYPATVSGRRDVLLGDGGRLCRRLPRARLSVATAIRCGAGAGGIYDIARDEKDGPGKAHASFYTRDWKALVGLGYASSRRNALAWSSLRNGARSAHDLPIGKSLAKHTVELGPARLAHLMVLLYQCDACLRDGLRDSVACFDRRLRAGPG